MTFHGDRWASRQSASLLRAAQLGECVAADLDGYVGLAVELAASPGCVDRLRTLRRHMRERVRASDACNGARFARNMESLYRQMVGARAHAAAVAPLR